MLAARPERDELVKTLEGIDPNWTGPANRDRRAVRNPGRCRQDRLGAAVALEGMAGPRGAERRGRRSWSR